MSLLAISNTFVIVGFTSLHAGSVTNAKSLIVCGILLHQQESSTLF